MEVGRMAIKRNKLGLSSVFKNLIVSASGSAVFEARNTEIIGKIDRSNLWISILDFKKRAAALIDLTAPERIIYRCIPHN